MSCFLLFSTKLLKICTNGLWFLLKDAKSFRSSLRREAWCPARRSTSRQTPGSSSPSSSGSTQSPSCSTTDTAASSTTWSGSWPESANRSSVPLETLNRFLPARARYAPSFSSYPHTAG